MKKIFYFDTETTGLDPRKHAIIQLGYIVEVDGEVKEEGSMLIQPFPGDMVSPEALKVNKRTLEEIKQSPFMPPKEAYGQIVAMLGKYCDKYNRADKFYPSGYNVGFDIDFLSDFFIRNGDKYFGSWFNGRQIDPKAFLSWADFMNPEGIGFPDYKLTTVCSRMGVQLQEAHDALSDIRATRELVKTIMTRYSKPLIVEGGFRE